MTSFGRAASSPAAVPVEKEPRHRPVFTNGLIQVLDVIIPPRASTLFHTHVHDLAGVTISSAPSRNEVKGEKPTDRPEEPEGTAWFMPFPEPWTHRIINLGSTDIHYVAFQLLQPPPREAIAASAETSPTGKVILENTRIRVVRMDLAPGEKSRDHTHRSGYAIVALTNGRIEEDGGTAEVHSPAGFVGWRDPSTHHNVRNVNESPLQLFEFEIRD